MYQPFEQMSPMSINNSLHRQNTSKQPNNDTTITNYKHAVYKTDHSAAGIDA